jgi:hypothetical protein
VIDLPLDDLRSAVGFGVAGNFAGHLEQAGEAGDFTSVRAAAPDAPKGLFPWYVPGADTFLGAFPLSSDRLREPASATPVNLQIEPEVGALCRVAYDADGWVTSLEPWAVGAFNDCSIRREGAPKISHKKNWGPHSKGVARRFFPVADLDAGGALAALRLASFLRRDGTAHEYGLDTAAAGYSYAGGVLLEWMVERLRNQTGAPGTPLEHVGAHLREAGCPATALVGIGATRYTDFGERTYLRAGDEAVVVVYDAAVVGPAEVRAAVRDGTEGALPGASVLCQRVEADTA